MFDLLFEYDRSGNINPIQGETLKLMGDGVPMILSVADAGLMNGNTMSNPFASVRTNKSFKQISNEVGMSTPFGKKSIFYSEEREILKGEIPKL